MATLKSAVAIAFLFSLAYSALRLLWDEDMPNLIG